jgi:zinc transporter, ZIP family
MEAGTATRSRDGRRAPPWLAGLLPLLILGAAIAVFVAFDAPGLGERNGVPLEELVVERTVLQPGEIELVLRNDGADPVAVRQAIVNDAFVGFTQSDPEIDRLRGGTVTIDYPWIEGQAYAISLVTSTGGTVDAAVDVAAETPDADAGFFGLMALIGLYVGVIPVTIGMLWLPWIRRIDPRYVQFLLALTLGLLAFLGIEAALEGTEIAATGSQAFGGAALVFLGAGVAYLALVGVDGWLRGRRTREESEGAGPWRLSFLVALGIGLHNLGEGLAIGSAYAIGSLALGTALVVGFALHNTTEGLAIVAPVARAGEQAGRARLGRLIGLGALAGLPAVLGAFVGASAFNPSLAAFMFGLGAGAIAQVIVQIAPGVRDAAGKLLHPLAVGGLLTGLLLMYATGLLISV